MTMVQQLKIAARMVDTLRPSVLYTCMVLLTLTAGAMLIWPPRSPQPLAFGFFGAACWALVGSRLLLVQRAMRQLRAPRASGSVILAVGLLATLTVVLPALLIIALDGASPLALTLLLLVNLAGLLWALGPMWLAVLAPIGTFVGLPNMVHLPETIQTPMAIALTLTALAYALWLWRVWLVRDPSQFALQRVPWVLRLGDLPLYGGLVASRIATQRFLQNHDRKASSSPRPRVFDRSKPVQTIRYFLGSPYALRQVRQARTTAAILSLFGLGSLLAGWLMHWNANGYKLALAGLAGMLAMATSGGGTIRSRKSASLNYLTELALLPGLGTPNATRRHLLRATLGWSVTRLAAIGFAMILSALLLGAPERLVMMMLAATALAFVFDTVNVVGELAMRHNESRPFKDLAPFGWFLVITLVVFTGIFVVGFNAAAGGGINRAIILILGIGWAILIPALLTRLTLDWRRFQRRPHPFLQC